MPGLVPGIHDFLLGFFNKDVDGRDRPGHDNLLCVGLGVLLPIGVDNL
jgi:hypothetical protein